MITQLTKLFVFSLLILATHLNAGEKGKIIAFAGISGSGKSSTARELAKLLRGTSFHEPEEEEWPHFIREKQKYGELSSLMVFRAIRIDALYRADALRDKGGLAIIDSYYEKLTAFYFGKPGMEWLMDPDDPYFSAAHEIMTLDVEHLPDADCIVLLDISQDNWIKFLESRNRARDSIDGFVENYLLYKSYVDEAASRLSSQRNIPLIRFEQEFSTPKIQAQKLKEILVGQKIVEVAP